MRCEWCRNPAQLIGRCGKHLGTELRIREIVAYARYVGILDGERLARLMQVDVESLRRWMYRQRDRAPEIPDLIRDIDWPSTSAVVSA